MQQYRQKSSIQPFLRILSLFAFAIASGCNNPSQTGIGGGEREGNAATVKPPVVVATTSVICDLTKQIAATTIDLRCLVQPGVDPHSYQPAPSDRQAIETAKLILYAGYDLDTSLAKLIKSSSNSAPKIAVHEISVPQPLYGKSHEHEGEHQGEHEGEKTPDPHIWHDAQNGIKMVETIKDNLKQISPNNSAAYDSNALKIDRELKQIDTWIKSQIQTIPTPQRKLIATHDALSYYANAYGLKVEGALSGLSTDQQPSAARVGELVKEIKFSQVPTIFAEAAANPKLIKTVAKEANVKLSTREIFADGLGESNTEGNSYQKMLISNTRTIVEGLGGRYQKLR